MNQQNIEKNLRAIKAHLKGQHGMMSLALAVQSTRCSIKGVTNWRQRGLLPFEPQSARGRYYCTVEDMLSLGLMDQGSFVFGPDAAQKFVLKIRERFTLYPGDGFHLSAINDVVIQVPKPMGHSNWQGQDPRFFDPNNQTDVAQYSNFLLYESRVGDKFTRWNTAVISFDLGAMFEQWTQNCASFLELESEILIDPGAS